MTRDDAVDLAVVLENVADVIIRYGTDGTVLWASPSLVDAFGYDPDEVVGTMLHLATDEDAERARAAMLQLIADHADVGSVRYRARPPPRRSSSRARMGRSPCRRTSP